MTAIKSALISVYYKDGLDKIVRQMHKLGIEIFSTGGTQHFIESLGVPVNKVEDLTGYPSILDGRVKTLHPKVFGGILAKRSAEHLTQLKEYEIPPFDLVIVDLYPFEETLASTDEEAAIIEKIDIGGISLIRAAAKNYNDVVIVPSREDYPLLEEILFSSNGISTIEQRKLLAGRAFEVSSHYDTAILNYFSTGIENSPLRVSYNKCRTLRYGENPHQQAKYYGDLDFIFEQLCGKELSYNNLVDIDAAMQLMAEFIGSGPTFAIIKHTNACGIASRNTVLEAWTDALAGDPVSAFGGILISNSEIDLPTAQSINELFYEVLIAPGFTDNAAQLLMSKSKRILLKLKSMDIQSTSIKTLLNGVILQDADTHADEVENFNIVTKAKPESETISDLNFALKCVKHLKSNAIVLAKNRQLLGMGCGQTSRVDACIQAIQKAKHFGFELDGAVMASDAFFPFPDCVELVQKEGINAVIQPGGSVKDQLSIDFCDAHNMAMVFTGGRHFKH